MAKNTVVASCMTLPLDRTDVKLTQLKSLEGNAVRGLVLAGWLLSEPAATTIDFREMGLTEGEAVIVAELLSKLPAHLYQRAQE